MKQPWVYMCSPSRSPLPPPSPPDPSRSSQCTGVLAWRIPGTVEPGRLPSMGLHRIWHNWRNLAVAAVSKMYMVFPVVMYGCESWTVKKAESRKIDAFELWCWRRFLGIPWTAKRSNQSILKEISPGCSLEGLMLKLKLQHFAHLTWRADSLEKILMLGGIGGRRRTGRQRMRWLNGITDLMDMSLSGLRELVMEMGAWRAVIHGIAESDTTAWLNWTERYSSLISVLVTYFYSLLVICAKYLLILFF